jgi:hypothetical protein
LFIQCFARSTRDAWCLLDACLAFASHAGCIQTWPSCMERPPVDKLPLSPKRVPPRGNGDYPSGRAAHGRR